MIIIINFYFAEVKEVQFVFFMTLVERPAPEDRPPLPSATHQLPSSTVT